jgi:manganese/zinc/iron transport system permease protein
MLLLSAATAAVAALAGFWTAWLIDASIAGCMATAAGVLFMLAFLFAPERGIMPAMQRRRRQRWEFARLMLAIHLLHHEGTAAAAVESREEHLGEHLRWEPAFARRVVREAEAAALLRRQDGRLVLTEHGRDLAAQQMLG